jgi:Histidine kinase-, DNA gyrase B-, and HSP90-like ATPase
MSYKDTALWQRTLTPKKGKGGHADSCRRLVHTFERFRDNVATVANEVHRDLPSLTVHDITHIDALWTTASLIAGYTVKGESLIPLNPAEAFVLGGSFLLHDLGNALAAYVGETQTIFDSQPWRDLIHILYRRQHGRKPTQEELKSPDPEIYKDALMERLRQIHASRAEVLAVEPIRAAGRVDALYLLEDAGLRSDYGTFIGQVAASHGWNLSKVAEQFARPLPAPPGLPWSVDLFKLACLLRLADAAQIDSTRAPSLLMRLRKLDPTSAKHWTFQERILGPGILHDRLYYRSREPFPCVDREAWWICFDTLQMIDRELREVDARLADMKSDWRFAARGVLFADDARRLARESIQVVGWEPVDTRVRITDAAGIVERLGGQQLYGDHTHVALRELLANAADAVRARRCLTPPGVPRPERLADWGRIVIRIDEEGEHEWLEVEDDGIGMQPHVMTGPLLDFGARYWGTTQAVRDHPGLASSDFEPTGRFGIGFYSVFMLGDVVRVISRHAGAAVSDTYLLEFDGVASRPLFRVATPTDPAETLPQAGTRVRVRLSTTALSCIPFAPRQIGELDA